MTNATPLNPVLIEKENISGLKFPENDVLNSAEEIKNRYSKKIGIFEQFNNTQSLTEDHCMKITGWTKAQFVEFSRQIVNINKTKHRKKNELIALAKNEVYIKKIN